MGVRKGLTWVHDFAVDNQASVTFDFPDGYTHVTVKAVNVSHSLSVHPSTAGVAQALDFRVFFGNSTLDGVQDVTGPAGAVELTETGISAGSVSGVASLWNMNVAAPLTSFSCEFTGNHVVRSHVFHSAAIQNQIVVKTTGAAATSGKVYVQAYKRTATVDTHDFTATPATEWDITGLKRNDGNMLILSSYDLAISSSAALIAQVSTDGGATLDDTAGDYRLHWVTSNGDDVDATVDAMIPGHSAGTSTGLCSQIGGISLLTKTMSLNRPMADGTASALMGMGIREERQTENFIRVYPNSGTINGGTGYATRYKL